MTREKREMELTDILMQKGGRDKLTRYLKEVRKMDLDEPLPAGTILVKDILDHEYPNSEQPPTPRKA